MEHFSISFILSSLGCSEELYICKDVPYTTGYLGANLYYPGTQLFRYCLYIVEGDAVPEPLLDGFYGCILIPTSGTPYNGPYAAETVVWPEPINAGVLLNEIQNLYLSQSSQAHMAHMMMQSLSRNSSIGSIVHQAATIMQNAIILLDPAYQLIAMESLGCEIDDIFWKDCQKNKRISDEHIVLIKDSGLTKELEQTSGAVLWGKREYFNRIPRLGRKIYSKDHVYLGTIAVIQCKHEFEEDDYLLLDALVETLSSVLVNHEYLTDAQKVDSQLLLSFLKPENSASLSYAAKRRLGEIDQYKFYQVGFIPLCRDPALSRLGIYLQVALISEQKDVLSSLESKNMVLLMCFEDFKEIRAMRQRLDKKLSPLGISIGLSPVFTDLSQTILQFALAEQAASLGVAHSTGQAHRIYPYQRVAHLPLFDALPKSVLEQFVHNSPLAILCVDKYLDFHKTLRCFVSHLGGYAETAQELFIHKNTLLYRLSRIQALTGIDYASSEGIFYAAAFFAIFDYLNNDQEQQ